MKPYNNSWLLSVGDILRGSTLKLQHRPSSSRCGLHTHTHTCMQCTYAIHTSTRDMYTHVKYQYLPRILQQLRAVLCQVGTSISGGPIALSSSRGDTVCHLALLVIVHVGKYFFSGGTESSLVFSGGTEQSLVFSGGTELSLVMTLSVLKLSVLKDESLTIALTRSLFKAGLMSLCFLDT